MKWRPTLDAMAAIAMTAASCVLVWSLVSPGSAGSGAVDIPLPTEPLAIDGVESKGHPTARVAVIEFSDFQCPFCKTFATRDFSELDREFIQTGKVRFFMRHLPLESIHPVAKAAAVAAACAGQQGMFWEMHDALFRSAGPLRASGLPDIAQGLPGFDVSAHSECVSSDGLHTVVADVEAARRLGVTGTPTFFVGTMTSTDKVLVIARFDGVRSIDPLRDAIRTALERARDSGKP